jgi:hypothetical protein
VSGTTWEVRTDGHRFIVCDTGSAPSTRGAYQARYSYPTQRDADAHCLAHAERMGHAHTAGREPRLETP